jgi:hypothetical protein
MMVAFLASRVCAELPRRKNESLLTDGQDVAGRQSGLRNSTTIDVKREVIPQIPNNRAVVAHASIMHWYGGSAGSSS